MGTVGTKLKSRQFAVCGCILATLACCARTLLRGASLPREESPILGPASIRSQANQNQGKITVQSKLVQIDAAVVDKNGKHISGLDAGNFRLTEDNQLQQLVAADYIDVSNVPASVGQVRIDASLMNENDPATLNSIGNNHRLIVLLIDRSSLFPEDLLEAVNAARHFVKQQMTPADLAAVVTFGNKLSFRSGLTNDRQVLDDALESLLSGRQPKGSTEKTTLDDSLSKTVPHSLDDVIADQDKTESRVDAVIELAAMLAYIPGRKSVVHFTGGFPVAQRNFLDQDAIAAAINAANDSKTSFYEVDARGLLAFGTNETNPVAEQISVSNSRRALGTIADETGGKVFYDNNDFADVMKQIQEASTGFYLLSYRSSNKQPDGRYHKVSVQLVNVPGGHISFRPGYYAPKN
jgi:VWFA-related protein